MLFAKWKKKKSNILGFFYYDHNFYGLQRKYVHEADQS